MASRRMRLWTSHYLPVWLALAFVILPILVGNMVRPKAPGRKQSEPAVEEAEPPPPREQAPPRWVADVNLGLLSFWMWALVTNAHDGRLVRTSGQKEATDSEERKQEFAVIILFLLGTLGVYLGCNTPIPVWAALICTGLTLVLPVVVLEKPEP